MPASSPSAAAPPVRPFSSVDAAAPAPAGPPCAAPSSSPAAAAPPEDDFVGTWEHLWAACARWIGPSRVGSAEQAAFLVRVNVDEAVALGQEARHRMASAWSELCGVVGWSQNSGAARPEAAGSAACRAGACLGSLARAVPSVALGAALGAARPLVLLAAWATGALAGESLLQAALFQLLALESWVNEHLHRS